MKNKILSVVSILMLVSMVFILTGCSTKKEDTKEISQTNTEQQEVSYLDYDRTAEFSEGIAVVSKTIDFKPIHYVIDKDFNVLFSYEGNSTFVGKYMLIPDKDDKTKINVQNEKGETVYSYDDKEYKKEVKLVENGCLIITEQTDTYNSSKSVAGIYSIEEEKYLLEPSEKYVNKIKEYGDKMLLLNDENTQFFNLETKSIVNFEERVSREFKDGYAIDDYLDNNNEECLKIFDTNGNIKTVKSLFGALSDIKNNSNGMLVNSSSRIETENYNEKFTGTNVQLFDFEKGTVKDLSKQFIMISDKVLFSKDGYALVKFSNQGSETYYTIIDKEGNMAFEPQKRNNEAILGAESNEVPRVVKSESLYEGNYFIVEDNDIPKVIDKDNKEILVAEENETFDGITNNVVLVHWEKPGYHEQYYYKDLQGNKVGLKVNGDIKKYN